MHTFSGSGIAVNQDWEGDNSSGATLADGVYRYTIAAQESGSGFNAPPIIGDVELDADLLVAKIDDPEALEAMLGQSLAVQGRASGTGFTSYTVDFAPGPDAQTGFTTIGTGSTPVSGGQLVSWNTSSLQNGVYTLRLRTTGAAGQTAQDKVTVKVVTLSALQTSPVYLSPNADGVLDTATFYASASVPIGWSATLRDPGGSVVRTLTGYGSVVNAIWDGRNQSGTIVPDSAYQVEVAVADPYSDASLAVTGTAVVDLVAPVAQIDAPTAGTPVLGYEAVPIVGSAQDANLLMYSLAYAHGIAPDVFFDFASASSPVTGSALGSLPGDSAITPVFSNGNVVLKLSVTDRAGNRSETSTTVLIDRIEIRNVASTPVEIDPYAAQTAGISYELTRSANVTIELYAGGSAGTELVATRVNAPRTAGSHTDVWDGRNNSGAVVARGGYYFSIVASDGSRTVRFNDPAYPSMGIAVPPYNLPSIKYNGVASLANAPIDPYRNDVLRMEYKLTESGKARVVVRPNQVPVYSPQTFEVGPPAHTAPDRLREVIWDGRLPNGTMFSGPFGVTFDIPAAVERDLIVVYPPVIRLVDVRTNPYIFHPTLAGVTNLGYTLERSAEVEVEVFDPNGNFLVELQAPTVQPPGTYSVRWNGHDATDEIVILEGSYRIQIRAEDVETGETAVRRASALVFR